VWIVDGEGSSEERWVVGDPVPLGYEVVVASSDLSASRGEVWVDVYTSDDWWTTYAGQRELNRPGMVVDETRVSGPEFAQATRDAYPCDDPWQIGKRAAAGGITAGVYAALVLLTFVLLRPWRRRPKSTVA
jgi:hypothetical protein